MYVYRIWDVPMAKQHNLDGVKFLELRVIVFCKHVNSIGTSANTAVNSKMSKLHEAR